MPFETFFFHVVEGQGHQVQMMKLVLIELVPVMDLQIMWHSCSP